MDEITTPTRPDSLRPQVLNPEALPDLYAALRDLLAENEKPSGDDGGEWDDRCRQARAALAKAAGEAR